MTISLSVMQYAAFVAASSVMQHMQPHPLANSFEAKLIRFGQISADLIRFVQNKKFYIPYKFDFLRLCQSVFYSLSV